MTTSVEASGNTRPTADVYIVVSPMQLVTALEAVHVFPSPRRELVLLTSSSFPPEAFAPILRDFSWARVTQMEILKSDEMGLHLDAHRLPRRKQLEYRSYFRQRLRRAQLNRIARLLTPARNLFIGNYLDPSMRHFANALKPETVYALDDGTDALRVPALRAQHNPPASSFWSARRFAHQWLHDWDDARIDRLGLFTSYDLTAPNGDFVVRHRYEFLRSRAARAGTSAEIFFVGQPLVEDGYISRAAHEANLWQVRERLRADSLVYIPHRRESKESVAFASGRLGLPIRTFDVPLEYHIAIRGPRPKALASFFSAAIENSRIIFAGTIPLIAFAPMESLIRSGPAFVKDIYDQFRRSEPDVEVVEI
jgi:hypothetical protein